MKNLFTYLKTLWGAWGNLQSTDVSLDCRLTVGSPSGMDAKWKQNPFMRFAVVLTLIFTIGSGNAWGQTTTTYTFTSKSWGAKIGSTTANWTSGKDGNAFLSTTPAGLQITTGSSGANGTSPKSFTNVTSVVITYNSSSKGVGNFKVKIGSNAELPALTISKSKSNQTLTFTPASAQSGSIKITGTCTTNSFSIVSVAITEAAAAGPTITTSVSSLTEVGYSTADFSQQVKSFTVSGSSLTANVTVTAPTNYEVCKTSGGTYTSSVSFDKGSGTLEASTVYVRLQSGKTAGNYNGNVACTSDEATTKNVAVSGSVPFTVTWKANGTTHATTYVTYATGSGTALGSLPDDPDPSDYTCSPKVFYGWYDGASYSDASVAPSVISTSTKITTDKTYNAVFATESNGSATYEIAGSSITGFDGGNGAYESGTYNTGDGFTIYCSNGYSTTQFRIAKSASITITSTIGDITQIVFTASGTDYKLNNNNISWTGTTGTYTNSGASTITLSNSNANIARITNIAITYGGTTYSNYATTCCTPLGTINGSISWTNPTTAVLTWDNIDHVSSWAASCIVHGGSSAGSVGSITTNGAGKKTCTVTGLSCNTNYDFTISATAASGYCDKSQTIENENSGTWSVSYDITNGSKTSGATTACTDDITAVFAASSGYNLPDKAAITVTGASAFTWTKGTGTLVIDDADITDNISISFTCPAVSCSGFSLHTGTKSGSDWLYNKCFTDADWGAADDAIWEGEFPSTNECYVGWQGSTSDHGTYWAVGGIKTYDIPTGRTLGWNSGNYYQDYPANAYGTFHIYKNSSDENSYLRFKPSAYVLRTGTDGTSWSSTAMTKSATNDHYYETAGFTLTSTLIDEHAYVALSANNVNGYVWCNFSSDVTAENNVKVKVGYGDEDAKFRATNLADGDAGKYGKFRIDVTKDVNNWKLAFVPMYKITYAAGTGATGSMAPSAYQEIGGTIAAAAEGFTDPTYKQFAGWSGSDGNDYAAGANVTMNSDVTLTAQWEDIPVTALTLNKSSIATYVNASTQTLSVSAVTPATANPAVTWSSSDATVASVTAGGVVSFLKAGTATITARSTISTGITATCTVNVYSVTCVVNGDDDVALAGVGIPTLTFTPATHTLTTSETGNYVFKSMTQSGGSWATSPSTTTGTTTAVLSATPTGNVTVTATYWKPRTVTWNIGDDNSHTSEVKYNTQYGDISVGKPVLDTDFDDDALSACGSNKFIGWVKASGDWTGAVGKTSTWYESNKPSASDAITSNTNYYAMFATASNFADNAYDLNNSGSLNSNWEKTTTRSAAKNDTYAGKTYTWQVYGESSSVLGEINTTNTYTNVSGFKLLVAASNATTVKLYYSENKSSWEEADSKSVSANSSSYTEYVFDVSSVPSSAVYLKITNSANSLYIKTATITTGTLSDYRTGCSVTCSRPTPSAPASVTKTSATISWAAGSTGTPESYEYKVWEDGTDEPVSGTTTTGTSVNLTGLYSGVTYHWKVKADCGDVDGESIWATGTNFTTTAANLTYSVPTGATAVTTPTTTAGNLNSAEVPASCGSCWAFVGWTTAAYAESSSAPATLFPAGIKAKVSGDATLYAVYGKDEGKYRIIDDISSITSGENYVLTKGYIPTTDAVGNANSGSYYRQIPPVAITVKTDIIGEYIDNPATTVIWKLIGDASKGRLFNETASLYIDLHASTGSIDYLVSSTSDYINITLFDAETKTFNIGSNTTSTNYLFYWTDEEDDNVHWWGVDDEHDGFSSCCIFKHVYASYATTPSCPKYTVTWDVNNGATTSTTEVTKCQGYLATLPSNPANTTLDACIGSGKGRFMGWSPNKVMPAQNAVPTGMFNDVEDAPEITDDVTFYAVFAEETTGDVAPTNKTFTFTSKAWADETNSWSSDDDGDELTADRGVKVMKSGAGGGVADGTAAASTKSSYTSVTKVVVTYSTNAKDGAGTIGIKVNDVSYTGDASVTTSGGTSDRTIEYTPASAQTGTVKINVECTTNSIFIKSVQIFYTGSTTTYEGYRTACCNDPQLKFLDGEGDPTTEYVIVREDLASSSAGVTIGCDISSLNTTGAITWTSTHRDKNDYASAYTWSSSQPVNLNIDIAKEEITAKETGVWQITISQAAGATTYCPEDATVTVRVKTIDKFIDAVNGNFSGEPQSLEDTGNGILLPTEAMFSTNNGCSTTRRLIGWIKASDLATYASSRRVDMIDDLKTSDPATNKVIAPGTKVQATGVTWYAVWGVEK